MLSQVHQRRYVSKKEVEENLIKVKGSNAMCSPSEDEEGCREDVLLILPRLHPMSTISKGLTKYIFLGKYTHELTCI